MRRLRIAKSFFSAVSRVRLMQAIKTLVILTSASVLAISASGQCSNGQHWVATSFGGYCSSQTSPQALEAEAAMARGAVEASLRREAEKQRLAETQAQQDAQYEAAARRLERKQRRQEALRFWLTAAATTMASSQQPITTQTIAPVAPIGPYTYQNFSNGLSSTSQQIGPFTYQNFNDGASVTSQKIGDFTYHNFSDGTSCTSQEIGNFTYTNCH